MTDDVDVAELFHENTSIWPSQVGVADEPLSQRDEQFARFVLPSVEMVNSCGLEQAIMQQRPQRSFERSANLSLRVLSRLLFFSSRYNHSGNSAEVRQVELYPVVFRVAELSAGVYRYAAQDHSLELVRSGEFGDRLVNWMLNQSFIADACVVFMLVGRMDRIAHGHGERGYRYMLMEAGHIAQNCCLVSAGMGLGSITLGGFVDSAVNQLLCVDGITQVSLCGVAVGVLQNNDQQAAGTLRSDRR